MTAKVPMNKETSSTYSRKILVMDDDVMVRKVVGKLLTSFGVFVEYAGHGESAKHFLRDAIKMNCPFDMVILDILISGGLGAEEIISELLKLDPNLKAVVSSGYENHPVMEKYKEYGFIAALNKPFNRTELSAVLNKTFSSG